MDRDHHRLDAALAAADRHGAELLPLLERWVRINSYTGNVAGANRVLGELAEAFALGGMTMERRAGDGCGDHGWWRTPAWDDSPPARRVMLIGHHDTVFPPGTFELWERDGDRLRGPGVLDMKGGLAVIRTAVAALADAGALDRLPLAVVSVADEETGSADSRPWLEERARGAGAALVFEAGRVTDQIVVERKGTGKVRAIARGKAAHAGNDLSAGVNAIWALARFIDQAQREGDPATGVTVNVGLVRGGTSANTVPAEADCELDFRFVRSADGLGLMEALDRIALAIAGESGAHFTIEGGVRRMPMSRTPAASRLAARYGEHARAEGLRDGEAPLQGGGSDGNTVSAVGVPAIDALGPRGRGFHTHDEHVEVSTFGPRTRALVRFLIEWGAAW
jgi:glutamate carboxypeptidase